MASPEYQILQDVLDLAYQRASEGKGKQRHSSGEGFLQQPIVTEGQYFGIGPHLCQIRKKAQEVPRLKGTQAKQNELLDIIVYAAGAHIVLDLETQKEK